MDMMKSTRVHVGQLAVVRGLFLAELYSLTNEERQRLQEETQLFLEETLNQSVISYHVETQGRIVAVAFLELIRKLPHPTRKTGWEGNVVNVYTLPDYRRMGLGEQLIRELLEEGRRLELDRITLMATPAGYDLYRKLGFKERGTKDRPMVFHWAENA